MVYHVQRFGVAALLSLPIEPRMARRLAVIDNLIHAYHDRDRYRDETGNPNWSEWASLNPMLNELLNEALRSANDED